MKPFRVAPLAWGALATAGGAGLYLLVGSLLMASAHHRVRSPPSGLPARTVSFTSDSGARLAAWLFVPTEPRGVVVLFHGIRGDRAQMIGRARLLLRSGFAVLAPDFQGHGESGGDRITFGYLESKDVASSLRYVRRRFPGLRVGAVGLSLGGASLLLAGRTAEPDAGVVEEAYSTLEEAVDCRVARRVGPLSRVLTPLLLLQLRPRLGFGADDLRPVSALTTARYPLLVIGGTDDREAPLAQTEALYEAAPEPKELWLVSGAGHVDLLRFNEAAYAAHVLPFLKRHLVTTD
jgi:fermentation-respiration switch protein FrsA (DUF1100 family)